MSWALSVFWNLNELLSLSPVSMAFPVVYPADSHLSVIVTPLSFLFGHVKHSCSTLLMMLLHKMNTLYRLILPIKKPLPLPPLLSCPTGMLLYRSLVRQYKLK